MALNPIQRLKYSSRGFNLDLISGPNLAARKRNAHDPRLAHDPLGRFYRDLFEQSGCKFFDLATWVAQTRDPQHGSGTDMKQSVASKSKKVDPHCGDVLAEVTGTHRKPLCRHIAEKLGMHQMNLTQVGLCGIEAYAAQVLHSVSGMGIAFHTQTRNDFYGVDSLFREAVIRIAVNRNHPACIHHHAHGSSRYHLVITYLRPFLTFIP